MYINKLLKKQLILSLSTFAVVGLIIATMSYALFTSEASNAADQVISVGDLSISFDGGTEITDNNIEPMTDAVALTKQDNLYTFTINNTGTVAYTYTIKLQDNPNYLVGGTNYSSNRTLLEHEYIRYNLNGGPNLTLGNQTDDLIYSGTINPAKSEEFTIRLWVGDATTYNLPNSALGSEIHLSIIVDGKASASVGIAGKDNSGANAPLLADNMIPVVYDNENDVWVKVKNKQTNWYNYDTQMWANAVTVKSDGTATSLSSGTTCTGTNNKCTRSDYVNSPAGTSIPMDDIAGMWVWIPRYEYLIDHPGLSTTAEEIHVNFVSGTNETATTNYLIHPAFRNGTVYKHAADYDLGGWDKELTGFWYAKFETGYAQNITDTTGAISSGILIKPNVFGMNYQTVSNEYTTAQNVQSDHGIGNTIETHMSKNDEWGAVAYLSNSKYGKYGSTDYNGENKEIYVNNANYSIGFNMYITGRSSGTYGGGTGSGKTGYGAYEYNNCPAVATTKTACNLSTRQTNSTKGTGASTTGSIYGIYDMSGGLYEYVMGNYASTISNSGFSTMPAQKYYNKYTSTELSAICNGVACQGVGWSNETGNNTINGRSSWYNDFMYLPESSMPWILRSYYSDKASDTGTGVFFNNRYNGCANYSYGFRVAISEKNT